MISVGSGGIFYYFNAMLSNLCSYFFTIFEKKKDREHKFRISYDIILLQYIYYGSYSRAVG